MEDQRLEEAWYRAHKNDPDYKKYQNQCCLDCIGTHNNSQTIKTIDTITSDMAYSMALQNAFIMGTIFGYLSKSGEPKK